MSLHPAHGRIAFQLEANCGVWIATDITAVRGCHANHGAGCLRNATARRFGQRAARFVGRRICIRYDRSARSQGRLGIDQPSSGICRWRAEKGNGGDGRNFRLSEHHSSPEFAVETRSSRTAGGAKPIAPPCPPGRGRLPAGRPKARRVARATQGNIPAGRSSARSSNSFVRFADRLRRWDWTAC